MRFCLKMPILTQKTGAPKQLPMNEQERTLASFLEEQLPDFDTSRQEDRQILYLLSSSIHLQRQEKDSEGDYRTVTITEDSDGKITAHSIKLYNVFVADADELLKFLSKAVQLFPIALVVKFTGGFLAVLAAFIPMMKLEFNEQDARVLLAIYKVHSKRFSEAEAGGRFSELGFGPITPEKLNASLVKLANAKVIRSLGHRQYIIVEKIRYVR